MRNYFTLLIALITLSSSAQIELSGFVRDTTDGQPVPSVYVVNKMSLESELTNENGFFTMEVNEGDSLVLSHLSYEYAYYVVEDSVPKRRVEMFDIFPKNYLLDEVNVVDYKYSTNKPRAMVLEEPNVPDPENVQHPQTQGKPSIGAPAEFLYWYFGNKPRQLRELAKLQEEDAYRDQLRQASNREILMKVTGLSHEELEALAFSCKFGNTPISTINDYDLLVSIINCYNAYLQKLEQERVLQDAEAGWDE